MIDYRADPLWMKLNMMNAEGMQAFAPVMEAMQKQLGQNTEMAQRAIEEYRKFLFLAMRAGHQVMPPGIISDMWMTQLQNAQSYWENLGQMMGERAASASSGTKAFASAADTWKATLESYETMFGMKPPMDIWGKGPGSEDPWTQAMNNWRKMFGM